MAVKATIATLVAETPSVRRLLLKLDAASGFCFEPGQWVDFQAPGVAAVGGYSICSTPAALARRGEVELCVKASGHPCAAWVHGAARVGDEVSLRVGGAFVLPPDAAARPCLFVAGGIGITALAAMATHLADRRAAAATQQQHHHHQQQAAPPPLLLYSASCPQEFALLPQLLDWQRRGALSLSLYTTRAHGPLPPGAAGVPHVRGRIAAQHLGSALAALRERAGPGGGDVLAFVCGPPAMSDELCAVLAAEGLPPDSVRTERWCMALRRPGHPGAVHVLLAVCLLAAGARRGAGMDFEMQSQTKCIFEELNANVIVVGDYKAANRDNPTLPIYVNVKVTDPSGAAVHENAAQTQGQFAFTTKTAGEYQACFTTHDLETAYHTKLSVDLRTGVAATDWDTIAKKEHLDQLSVEMRKVEGAIREIYAEMLQLQQREQEMRDLNEETNARVAWFSIFSLAVCVASAGFQLVYLKKFFQRKKLL
ncbi:emp24 domain-containing protein [Scenedesmus sp. PABB004]|nr:emp24 domain-containing protein [Scenedesmus sp. PABB004]